MNAFCASENCDAFIVFRSFPSQENAPENSNQKRSSLKGSDQLTNGLLRWSRYVCCRGKVLVGC
ncbi:hypothetical protein EHH54_38165 [Rhizobium leguminosarum]|nr:hypothetical protein EHH54_38165 [Rhizobium leguminosarum]TAW18360.1 hypothetical protein ELI25_22420 [Rhizobium ruizarguesonis]TAY60731.1 hypothetical protein ELH84_36775 [Rhizobium ruizarguesonis]TAZ43865.1 hypothetical protein ELH76_36695 [Rhizobium ruizarguesonis]